MGLLENYTLTDEELKYAVDDGWDGEPRRHFPRIERIEHRSNSLSPSPPENWWAVLALEPSPHLHYPPELGAWMLMLDFVQGWERHRGESHQHGKKLMHRICRDIDGRRILVVHPDLHGKAHEWLAELDGESRCSCGGMHLEPEKVERAMATFAGRLWDAASPAERMEAAYELIENEGVPQSVVLESSSDWMKKHGSLWGLYQLAEQLSPAHDDARVAQRFLW